MYHLNLESFKFSFYSISIIVCKNIRHPFDPPIKQFFFVRKQFLLTFSMLDYLLIFHSIYMHRQAVERIPTHSRQVIRTDRIIIFVLYFFLKFKLCWTYSGWFITIFGFFIYVIVYWLFVQQNIVVLPYNLQISYCLSMKHNFLQKKE